MVTIDGKGRSYWRPIQAGGKNVLMERKAGVWMQQGII